MDTKNLNLPLTLKEEACSICPECSLAKSQLAVGTAYITSQGDVLIFLGYNKVGHYVFYTVCSVAVAMVGYSKDKQVRNFTVLHAETQISFATKLANTVLLENEWVTSSAFTVMKGYTPKIIYSFATQYTSDYIKLWWNSIVASNLPSAAIGLIVSNDSSEVSVHVAAKDLRVGSFYRDTSSTDILVYLGRTATKSYLWMKCAWLAATTPAEFAAKCDSLLSCAVASIRQSGFYLSGFRLTERNKKVQLLNTPACNFNDKSLELLDALRQRN
jgi:hypothetical protein